MNLKKRALQIGLPRDKNRNGRTNENTNGVGLHLTLLAASMCSDYKHASILHVLKQFAIALEHVQ
jgi:hypothetical protein